MAPKVFSVLFDNENATFRGGEMVKGRVIIVLEKPSKMRGVKIHFKGEAATKWTQSKRTTNRDGASQTQHVHYTGHEIYFDTHYYLVGGKGSDMTLEGENCYPFQMVLPPNCPSSFEGSLGHIRYSVTVVIDRPWKFDHEVLRPFTVYGILDLNTHHSAKNPVKLENSKTFCCLCCTKGSLTLAVSLPVMGYVPKQEMPITVEVDNASSVDIETVRALLKKKITYIVTSPRRESRVEEERMGEVEFENVVARNSKTMTKMMITPLTPPTKSLCNIIDIEYKLTVKAEAGGCYNDLVVKTPIIIGSIPLQASRLPPDWSYPQPPASVQNYSNGSRYPNNDSFQDPATIPLLPQQPYPEVIAPPPVGFAYPPASYISPPGIPQPSPQPSPKLGYPPAHCPQPGYPLQPFPPQPGYPPQPSPQLGHPSTLPGQPSYPSQPSPHLGYPPPSFVQPGYPAQPSPQPGHPPKPSELSYNMLTVYPPPPSPAKNLEQLSYIQQPSAPPPPELADMSEECWNNYKQKRVKKMYIEHIDSELVLDVKGGFTDPGTEVIVYEYMENPNQQWKLDDGYLISKASGLVLDMNESTGRIFVSKMSGATPTQQWCFEDDYTIRNKTGKVLELVDTGDDYDNAERVIAAVKHGGPSQLFKYVTI